jgi:hypothetical protein
MRWLRQCWLCISYRNSAGIAPGQTAAQIYVTVAVTRLIDDGRTMTMNLSNNCLLHKRPIILYNSPALFAARI